MQRPRFPFGINFLKPATLRCGLHDSILTTAPAKSTAAGFVNTHDSRLNTHDSMFHAAFAMRVAMFQLLSRGGTHLNHLPLESH